MISLYGIWDRDERWLYADTTLHRAISDLTLILQENRLDPMSFWPVTSTSGGNGTEADPVMGSAGFQTVFDRLHTARTANSWAQQVRVLSIDVSCGRGKDCRHVRTFAFHRKPELQRVPERLRVYARRVSSSSVVK